MAYVRKRSTKRSYKKRPYYRKRRFNMRRRGIGRMGRCSVLRWSAKDTTNNCHVQYVGNDVNNSADFGITFTVTDAANSTDMTNLFDNYRITRVMYRWVAIRSTDWASTTTLRGYDIRVTWCHDFNSATTISRLAQMQRSNVRECLLNQTKMTSKWYSLKPAVLQQLYEGATTTAYSPKWKQWLDTNDPAPHYGILGTYSELNAGLGLRLEAKLYFDLKGVV